MSDSKLKLMEMIQDIIKRMAQNSFMLKGWTVTLVSALFALSKIDTNKSFFFIAYVPILVFWLLDSYYLQLERQFRVLYRATVTADEADLDYSMKLKQPTKEDETEFCQSFFSKTEMGFYLPLALLTLLIFLAVYFMQKI